MNDSPAAFCSYPPRLSMDDYANFVEASLADCDPVLAARQKNIEERIRASFRMSDDAISAGAKGEPHRVVSINPQCCAE